MNFVARNLSAKYFWAFTYMRFLSESSVKSLFEKKDNNSPTIKNDDQKKKSKSFAIHRERMYIQKNFSDICCKISKFDFPQLVNRILNLIFPESKY